MDEFLELCREVRDRAKYLPTSKERAPHYQRVLDFIVAHPEHRSAIGELFVACLAEGSNRIPVSIHLLRFCMTILKWPEVEAAAKRALDNEVNSDYAGTLESLLKVYKDA